jgi:hypothetical protein
MTDRIDQYLAGKLGRDALTDGERLEADATAHAVDDTHRFLAARETPDVSGAVMRRLDRLERVGHAEPSHRPRVFDRVVRRLWARREVSIRPAYVLLAAAACVAALGLIAPRVLGTQADAPPLLTEGADPRLFVRFRLEAEASTVSLAGSFTNWEPVYQLHQVAPGVWTITLPLSQGVHDYAFIVDGQQWIADPDAPRIDDGFGGTNSRLTLLLPETPRT